jgi:regulator of sigma E protease
MYLEKILTFVLFLGPLVFFHELGHFFFARLFGVRVEVFSIGFGPKLIKFKKNETEYALSAIPLGGYVKMFGDDPFNKENIPEDERQYSYNHQGKWARFWIVLGGPLTNFLLAFAIFYSLLISGEKIPEIKLGRIEEKAKLYSLGFRTGDVISKVNKNEIYNPADLVGDGQSQINEIEVRRNEKNIIINLNLKGDNFFEELIKHPPMLRKPLLVNKDGKYFGLSTEKGKLDFSKSLEEIVENFSEKEIYLYKITSDEISNDVLNWEINSEIILKLDSNDLSKFLESLNTEGFYTVDMMVKSINLNSPADKAGIKGKDIFISLNKNRINSFEEFRSKLQEIADQKVTVTFLRDGKLIELSLTPEEQIIDGKKLKLLGVYSYIEIEKPKFIKTQSKGIFGAIVPAFKRSVDSFKKTLDGFYKIITNQVSFKSVGGVITIGKVANDSFNISISYFLQLMALISVNLGIINLFPMLPLDGGHIMFIFLELVNGGPISRRKMEIAQQVGLSILLMLMVGAIFNDVSRFF